MSARAAAVVRKLVTKIRILVNQFANDIPRILVDNTGCQTLLNHGAHPARIGVRRLLIAANQIA